jgi:tRNA 2-thiouridine synthesizing protein A
VIGMDDMTHDHVFDIKGLCCSAPVLKLTKAFKQIPSGDVALVISDKCSMINDIPAYCSMMGHELVHSEEADGLYRFWIRKM